MPPTSAPRGKFWRQQADAEIWWQKEYRRQALGVGGGGTEDARGERMHPMAFVHKRVHLSAVATGRKMFAGVDDMTAARFDLLHVLHTNRRLWIRLTGPHEQAGWMTQSDLRRELGVARQTVWKMVKRLVELGLVVKELYAERFVMVRLTKDGLARMSAAYQAAFTEREKAPPANETETAKQVRSNHDGVSFDRERVMTYLERFRRTLATSKTVGRDVAKVFATYAWERAGGRHRHGMRQRDLLDQMIRDTREIARALGDTSALIYPFGLDLDH